MTKRDGGVRGRVPVRKDVSTDSQNCLPNRRPHPVSRPSTNSSDSLNTVVPRSRSTRLNPRLWTRPRVQGRSLPSCPSGRGTGDTTGRDVDISRLVTGRYTPTISSRLLTPSPSVGFVQVPVLVGGESTGWGRGTYYCLMTCGLGFLYKIRLL